MKKADREEALRLIGLRDARDALERRLAVVVREIAEMEWAIYGMDCISLSEAGRQLAPLLGKSVAAARMWVTRTWRRDGIPFYVNPQSGRPHVWGVHLRRVRDGVEVQSCRR